MSNETVTAAVLVIGDEILSGRTRDENLCFLAKHLADIGIDLNEARVVPDVEDVIVDAVNVLRASYDYVFTTGGIGPTHDDITALSVAKAFQVRLIEHEGALDLMREYYGEEGLTPARRRMALLPQGVRLVDNPVSKAPGFMMENVIILAGIPSICRAMMDGITPHLRKGPRIFSLTIRADEKESEIASLMERHHAALGQVSIGSYPFFEDENYGVNIVLRGADRADIDAAAQELMADLREHGANASILKES